jgi:hypothetical protein
MSRLIDELRSLPKLIGHAIAHAEARGKAAGRAEGEGRHEQVIKEVAEALDAMRAALGAPVRPSA